MQFYFPVSRINVKLVAALLLLLFKTVAMAASPVVADGERPPVGDGTVDQATPGDEVNLPGFADTTHQLIEQDILERVIAFDDLFGRIRSDNQRQTKYQLRWRNSLRFEQGGPARFGTTARLNVTLSKISDRLRLVVAGEDEVEQRSASLPADPGMPGFDRTNQPTQARLVNTEVRYGLLQSPDMESFLGIGVRVVWPPEAFGRWRFQFTKQLAEKTLFRASETFFIKNALGLGETTDFSLEQLLDPTTLLRWSNSATASQEFQGLEWGSELSLNHQLDLKSTVTLTGGVYGNTVAAATIESYRLLARYRRQFLREWLYFELEPEISWPRTGSGGYPAVIAGTCRLEIVFAGSSVALKPRLVGP